MRRGAKQQLIAVLGFCAAAYAMHVESQLRRSEIDPSFSYEPGCNVGGFSCTGVRTVLCWLMLASANSSARTTARSSTAPTPTSCLTGALSPRATPPIFPLLPPVRHPISLAPTLTLSSHRNDPLHWILHVPHPDLHPEPRDHLDCRQHRWVRACASSFMSRSDEPAATAACIFSSYFLYVLKAILGEFCIVCCTFHTCNFSMLFLSYNEFKEKDKKKKNKKKAQ